MSKEFRIGLIALVAGVLLYYGFNYLKGTDVLSKTNRFYVVYDHINGLAPGSTVNIQGVQVGRVSELAFNQKKQTIVVALDIQGDIELGDSTIAELASAGFLGGQLIILKERKDQKIMVPGDTLIAEFDERLAKLLESAEPIPENIQSLLLKISAAMEGMDGFGTKLSKTILDLDTVLLQTRSLLSENDSKISASFSKLDTLITNLNKVVTPMGVTISNFESLSDSLKNAEFKATITSTNDLLQNLSSTLDSLKSEQGTLGRLMSDDSLYNNLNTMLVDMDKLLIHFNNYPKDFMGPLGKKNKNLKGIQQD
ncbi:MAG: MCE family protein [Cytophagales bacterium]|nr:MCE family protein [Cytophagales bacterium]